MQNYQKVGVIVSVIGLLFVLLVPFGVAMGIMLLVGAVSFVGLILSLINVKHSKKVGIIMIILGVFGNLLLIMPGIMAYRYKPKNGGIQISDREKQDREIEETRNKLEDLEREKERRDNENKK